MAPWDKPTTQYNRKTGTSTTGPGSRRADRRQAVVVLTLSADQHGLPVVLPVVDYSWSGGRGQSSLQNFT